MVKRKICSLLTMALLLGNMSTINTYAATREETPEFQKVVSEYMEMRFSNMQETVEDWSDLAVAGIVKDEALYANRLKETGTEVLSAEYEIGMANGEEIVHVDVLESMEICNDFGRDNVEVVHKLCVVQKDNKEYIVVSDGYYDANLNFASCSYVDETALIEPCAFGGSPLCIISVASKEIGYCEKATNAQLDSKTANIGDANYTKYGKWYGMNGEPWCAMFVSWCANQAKVSTNVIPKVALTENGVAKFKSWGRFEYSNAYAGDYTPKAGDIFYLSYDETDTYHTGIVVSVSGNTMTFIDGNNGDQVCSGVMSLTDSSLLGFGRPAYATRTHSWKTSYGIQKCSLCGAINYEALE